MRTGSVRKAGVLVALTALTVMASGRCLAQDSMPTGGFATGYAPPAVQLPYPFYNTHPESGGLFIAGSYIMYHQTNPMQDHSQPLAYRGFVATDDTVLNAAGSAGTFVGTRNVALSTQQVSGPYTFVPGFQLEVGWKFGDGSALTATFWWITQTEYRADATLAQPIGNGFIRSDQADTFLFSPVYNFPSDFAGAPNKVVNALGAGGANTAGPYSVYGIWNGASVMTEVLWQWTEQFYLTYRKPFYETECYRASAVVGPRWIRMQDKFRWVTTDLDINGQSSPIYVATYNNIVTNNNYGFYVGLQQEWYLGWGLAAMLTVDGGAFMDVVTTKAGYERGYHNDVQNYRGRHMWRPTGLAQVTPGLMWYPLEGIQLQFNYDFFAVINTVASGQQPVDFNYSSLTPPYNDIIRYFNGFQATVAFVF